MKKLFIILLAIIVVTIGSCNRNRPANEWYSQALDTASKGDFRKAKKQLEKSLTVDPKYLQAEESLKVVNQAIDGKIDADAAVHFFKGVSWSNKGSVAGTFAELNKAIALDPHFSYALYERGLAYGRRGKFSEAINDFTKVIDLNPNDAAAYNNRGLIYARVRKQFDMALADFTKAIEINPDFADAYNNRGTAHRIGFNNKRNACSDWKKACASGLCNNYEIAKQDGYCE